MKSIAIITNLPFEKYSKSQFYYTIKEHYEVIRLKNDVYSINYSDCVIMLPDWFNTEHTVWLAYYATKIMGKPIVSRGTLRNILSD
jgi:hypothetical protein